MATCPNCNGEVKDTAKFCKHCGSKIEEIKKEVFCEECGAKVDDGAAYCDECGAKLDGAPAQNDDPWADFKDFKQPETVVIEKVIAKETSKQKADITKLTKEFEKGCAFYDAGEFATALPLLLPLAQEGDAEAQFRVGYCHMNAEQYDKAMTWFEKARAQSHPKAAYNIAWMYGFGKGVAQDESKWLKYTKESAILGFISAYWSLGRAYYYGFHDLEENYEEAFKWLKKAADSKPDTPARIKAIAEAQYMVAMCYDFGNGVDEDKEEAYRWYKKSSDNGYNDAHGSLALGYQYGWYGMPEDKEKAFKLYEKGAKGGDSYAQWRLGECYETGEGTAELKNNAFKWYKKSAEAGNVDGQCAVGRCYAYGIGTNDNPAEGIKWLTMSAEAGNAEAWDILGSVYADGITGKVDYNKAMEYYKKATEGNHWNSFYHIAQIYLEQNNYKQAAITLKKGADRDDIECLFALAKLKAEGGSIEKMIKDLEEEGY